MFKARLCYVDITGDSRSDMTAISEVVTDNFENVLPIYDIRNDLKETIQQLKRQAAQIEENRFGLAMDLQKEQTRLKKLSDLAGTTAEIDPDNLVLEFTDVSESSAFLCRCPSRFARCSRGSSTCRRPSPAKRRCISTISTCSR